MNANFLFARTRTVHTTTIEYESWFFENERKTTCTQAHKRIQARDEKETKNSENSVDVRCSFTVAAASSFFLFSISFYFENEVTIIIMLLLTQ